MFGSDRMFYRIWGLVLWLRVGDGNSKLLHDLMQLDILCLSTCAPVVHRSILPCCSGSVQICFLPFLDPCEEVVRNPTSCLDVHNSDPPAL